jgi:large subunit ribosomal protein L23
MMRDPRSIIIEPVVTEKTTYSREAHNEVAFRVVTDANKIEIKHAVEEIFGVTVVGVRTMNVMGKMKRLGRYEGRRPAWKKAIVSLKEGDTIEFFEHA